MSTIAALKGYRTQFLYSLYFILSNVKSDQIFPLEGEEYLDVLDNEHNIIYAIKLKILSKPITLSDILSEKKTSFIKRFIENYVNSIPMMVSYGEISQDLKSWNQNKDNINRSSKNSFSKIFNDVNVSSRVFLGSYVRENDILKRPITKFIQDISKDIGLIR